jgi:endonuclease YncB( thermonuclease family)
VILRPFTAVALSLLTASPSFGELIRPNEIDIVDAATIEVRGQTIRLVGIVAPETGRRASCVQERALGSRAAARLRQLIWSGGLDLKFVRCSCRTESEVTPACNFGRACGMLLVNGRNVGEVLVKEKLVRSNVCTRTSCPAQAGWCG